MTISKQQIKKYLSNPNRCFLCNSENLSYGDTDFGTADAWRNITCLDCKHAWVEGFQLRTIENLEKIS